VLAERTFLAIFVAWGSILEMTSAYVVPFHVPVKTYWPERRDIRYTSALVKMTTQGWPVTFRLNTTLPKELSPFKEGIRPGALLCDLIVLGVLVVAAWNLLGTCRLQFDLADMFTVTTSVALMLSFHIVAWDHHFEVSQFAIDVGVFSAAITIIRTMRKFAARLSWWRARRAGGN
jgi:hypothetical protein